MTRFLCCGFLLLALHTTTALLNTTPSLPATSRSVVSTPHCHSTSFNKKDIIRPTTFLHLSSPQDDETIGDPNPLSTGVTKAEPVKDYPIDAPSPILLSSSMLLAIGSVGTIFELVGGSPMMGVIPSALFALVGLPSCLFLFYAAIKKGTAETEEDDAEYRKNYY